ncbi:phosphocholine-specific phospholipase C [Terracidiphilus gabretensis]|uniref:phosphocholine-specific phospholipase C n=1 Tax=Terracidiphilus gabretensis TaxID=1577687 RepID=UPI00071B723B|nr:phospholipase C, phosphocholine-specific [Terracidiphilus gabretensis]
MHTRRNFLKYVAMMSGAAGLSELTPEAIQRAYAIEPEHGSTYLDAEYVVILMQENRSFDHTFGTLQGVRGFNDPRAMRLANGNSVFVQTDAAGNSYAPWRLNIHDTRITWMGSLPHSRESQVDAWNEGLHDGWLEAKRSGEKDYAYLPLTMGHYTREDLPFYYALADAFTICDQNYCSVMTSTSPNRSYFWTGTIREQQNTDAKIHIRNEQIDDGGMTWKTFPERLQEAGVSWKSYQNDLARSGLSGEEDAWLSNYGDNVLECFAAYNVEAYPGFVAAAKQLSAELVIRADKLESEISATHDAATKGDLHKQLDEIHKQMEAVKAAVAQGGEVRYNQLSEDQKALHHAAFVTNAADPDYHALESLSFELDGQQRNIQVPKGDVLHQFRKDVNEGKLPAISWLTASERFSDHPSSPWYGAWYISEIMDILTKNPEVWKKTIFIVTYDENDGYFDHAPSFVAADPRCPETGHASEGIDTGLEYCYKQDELRMGVVEHEARTGPIGMGFRVPLLVASPWSRGGWVNSQLFDHTSTLMFLERFIQEKYGKTVREENISAWRRTVAGDLTSVFRPYNPQDPQLDYLNRDKHVLSIAKARYREVPSNYAKLTAVQVEKINHTPHDSESMPQQEKGIRPACALPYELYADCRLGDDGTQCEVRLSAANHVHGTNSAGAPFNVYLRNLKQKGMRAATYTVKAGDTLTIPYPLSLFADSRYEVEIHGPNGFYRMLMDRGSPLPIEARAEYESRGGKYTGNVLVHLRNRSHNAAKVEITDNAYQAKPVTKLVNPGQEVAVVMQLEQSHGWYDFTVTSDGTHSTARFAGRVETGAASKSDPAMGRTI